MPGSLLSRYSPVPGRSVPLRWVTRNCSGDSPAIASSVFLYSVILDTPSFHDGAGRPAPFFNTSGNRRSPAQFPPRASGSGSGAEGEPGTQLIVLGFELGDTLPK